MGKNKNKVRKNPKKNPLENDVEHLINCKNDVLNSSNVSEKVKEILGKLVRLTDGKMGYVFSVIYNNKMRLYRCHICKTKNMSETQLIEHTVWPKHMSRMKMTVHFQHKFLLKEEKCFTQTEENNEQEDLPVTNIQNYIDDFKEPLVGLEYLLEIVSKNNEYKYFCLLCSRMESLDSIFKHLTNSNHQLKFLIMFFPTAAKLLKTFRNKSPFKFFIRLCDHISRCVEHVHGRLKPRQVQSQDFSHVKKEVLLIQVDKSKHIRESDTQTFSECVDPVHLKPGMCPYVSELESEDSHFIEPMDDHNDSPEQRERRDIPCMQGSITRESQNIDDGRRNTDMPERFERRDMPFMQDSNKRESLDVDGYRRNTDIPERFERRAIPFMQDSIKRETRDVDDYRRNTDMSERFERRDIPYMQGSMKRESRDIDDYRRNTDMPERFERRDTPYMQDSIKRDVGDYRRKTDIPERFERRDSPYSEGSFKRESQDDDYRRNADMPGRFERRDIPYMQGSNNRESRNIDDYRRNTDMPGRFERRDIPHMQGSIKRESRDVGDYRRNTDMPERFERRDNPNSRSSFERESRDVGDYRRNTVNRGYGEHTFSRYSNTPSTSRSLEGYRNERYHRDDGEFCTKSSIWDEIHVADSDQKIIKINDKASHERSYRHWNEVYSATDQRINDTETIPNEGKQKQPDPPVEHSHLDNSDCIGMVSVLRDLSHLYGHIGILGEKAYNLLQSRIFSRSIKSPTEEHCFFLSLVKQKLLECLGLGVLNPRLSSLAQNIIRRIIYLTSDHGIKSLDIHQDNTEWSRHVGIVNKPYYSICEVPKFVRRLESVSHLSYVEQDIICCEVCAILNEEGRFKIYEDELFALIKTILNSKCSIWKV